MKPHKTHRTEWTRDDDHLRVTFSGDTWLEYSSPEILIETSQRDEADGGGLTQAVEDAKVSVREAGPWLGDEFRKHDAETLTPQQVAVLRPSGEQHVSIAGYQGDGPDLQEWVRQACVAETVEEFHVFPGKPKARVRLTFSTKGSGGT